MHYTFSNGDAVVMNKITTFIGKCLEIIVCFACVCV